MIISKFCTRKRLQLCLKILLILSIIGVYFIVLLRESFAAWESSSIPSSSIVSTKSKNGIIGEVIYQIEFYIFIESKSKMEIIFFDFTFHYTIFYTENEIHQHEMDSVT